MFRRLGIVVVALWLVVSILGCDAFVRKFTRKPKREQLPQTEMVLIPQEYTGPAMSKEEQYRQVFLYWKSWHDELISALTDGSNQKKRTSCAREALDYLTQLRPFLPETRQKRLDRYISRMQELSTAVADDAYGRDVNRNRSRAERLRMDVLRDLSPSEVKDSLA